MITETILTFLTLTFHSVGWLWLGPIGQPIRRQVQSKERSMQVQRREGGPNRRGKSWYSHALHCVLSSCSSSHAHAHSCCVTQRTETHFLFCSSRNVGHPDRLAFHWQSTAESSPGGSFTLACVCECVFVYLLYYLCYQPTRPHPWRQSAGKRKPESVRRVCAEILTLIQWKTQFKQPAFRNAAAETKCVSAFPFTTLLTACFNMIKSDPVCFHNNL